ncbi:MAG: aldo/keto reductase [Lentisphaerae bacterium]|nr:aldo/keto reductase [Lentisphaerota bacterium]
MDKVRLGRTGLMVTRTAFGVLPIQRTDREEAARILRKAYDAGINFFDTARGYTDSEEKIGYALGDVRDRIIIATKSGATTRLGLLKDLETSLGHLKTHYVDILQLHNPAELADPDDAESSYAGLVEAREKGMIRFAGITQHSIERAEMAVSSGLYDTMQFPLCTISSERDWALADRCRKMDMGLIAMKALSGGLLTNARAAFAFMRTHEDVVPIWGIQHMTELEEFLALDKEPPEFDDDLQAVIERDRTELSSEFCRACGYCLPCPVEIPIPMAARMPLLLGRMPTQRFGSPEWREKMARIRDCTDCGHCRDHCPYDLDPPAMMANSLAAYEAWLGEHEKQEQEVCP